MRWPSAAEKTKPFDRKDRSPSQMRYAAPASFTAVKAVAEAARMALMPNAAASTWIMAPVHTPQLDRKPASLPCATVRVRMNTWSAPGDTLSSTAAARKTRNCSRLPMAGAPLYNPSIYFRWLLAERQSPTLMLRQAQHEDLSLVKAPRRASS